jgi:tetratricopeptide (TPR) repeat protein
LARPVMHYRVFIASPSGLEEERKAFRDVLAKYNARDGNSRGVNFDPVGWEATLGQQGRPQAIINEEVRSCDFFVLVLHDRWGSPPGGGTFTSGTEEELSVAVECLDGKPQHPMQQIVVVFKSVSERQLADPGPELSKVLDFKKRLEREKKFLYQTFDDLSVFTESVDRHLAQWARVHERKSPTAAQVPGIRPKILNSRPGELHDDLSQRAEILGQIDRAEQLFAEGKIVEAELAFSGLVVKFDDSLALAKFGRFLRKTGNRHRATDILTRALELSKMNGEASTEAYVTRQLGQLRERNGDIPGAIAQYGHSLQTYQSANDLSGQARTHRDLALAHRKLGDHRRALEHLEQSKILSEELGDENGIAAALGYQGVLYKSQGDLVSAIAAHEAAIAIQERRGDSRGRAAAQSNLAIIYRMMERFDEARALHSEALNAYRQQHDRQGESRELSNLGTLERALGCYDRAVDLHLQALAIAEQLQNKHGIAIQYGNLGRNYAELGNLDESERLHVDALNLCKSLDDFEGQAWQHEGLGHVEWRRQNLPGAERRFEAARTEFARLGAKYGQALSAHSLGMVLLEMGRRAEGVSQLAQAKSLFLAQGLTKNASSIEEALAKANGGK